MDFSKCRSAEVWFYFQIEKMVLELKQGFVEVMEALSVMQEDDGAVKKNLADMSDTLETVQVSVVPRQVHSNSQISSLSIELFLITASAPRLV